MRRLTTVMLTSRITATLPAVLLAGGLMMAQENTPESQLSREATLALRDPAGNEQDLGRYRGKIVVLNFWATWCVPCREEMPLLVSIQKRYGERGIQVIGASADQPETQKEIPRFVRKLKINFPVWIGATTDDMQSLGLGDALPATAFIDRDGSILARIIGPVEKKELDERVEWLLGDRRTPPPPPLVNNIEKLKASAGEHDHEHEGEEDHEHGGVGIEGASTVPS